MAASQGGTGGAERNDKTSTPMPGDPLSTEGAPDFRQGGAQTTWNPASHMLYMHWYQYYYQMLYYSQLYNWQMYMSSQGPGLLTGSSSQSASGSGLQPLGGQTTTPQTNPRQANATQPAVHARTSQARQGSCEARIGTIPRRVMAELIDFVFLYFTRFMTFSLFYDDMDQANRLHNTLIIDENMTLEAMEEFVVQALTYRFLVLAYEVFFLIGGFHGSLGGATPGKYLMSLTVVSAEQVHTLAVDQAGERVKIVPGGNLGFWRALVRATIKNFSATFLFPVCLTVLFFQHNRTIYDIAAGSAVVTSTSRVSREQRQQQQQQQQQWH